MPLPRKDFTDRELEDYVLDRMDHEHRSELEERASRDPLLSQRLREVRDVLDPLRRLGESILREELPPALKAWLGRQKQP